MHYVKRTPEGYSVFKPDNMPASGRIYQDAHLAQQEKEKLDRDSAYKNIPPGLTGGMPAVGQN